jgi:hypothetical protein
LKENQLNIVMSKIGQDFSDYRESQNLSKSGRVRKYPDSLRDRCLDAVEMGTSVTDMAAVIGTSTTCIDRWRLKGKAKKKPIQKAPERPTIEIFKVKEHVKKENPPLILSMQGMRIEIRLEDEYDISADS